MDHSLAFTAGWNSSLLAFFFLMGVVRNYIEKRPLWAVVSAAAVYFTVCDAVKFFNL